MFGCFKLQPIGEHFLKHPAQSVQKNNWAKQLDVRITGPLHGPLGYSSEH
jgi:hypothetical protein